MYQDCYYFVFFFFKQKTAYEMRISDWSSDVCSSDLVELGRAGARKADFDFFEADADEQVEEACLFLGIHRVDQRLIAVAHVGGEPDRGFGGDAAGPFAIAQGNLRKGAVFDRGVAEHGHGVVRSEEHTTELQSLMRISSDVFCLKNKQE